MTDANADLIGHRIRVTEALLSVAPNLDTLVARLAASPDRASAIAAVGDVLGIPTTVAEHVFDARIDIFTAYRLHGLTEELAHLREQIQNTD